MNRIISKKKVEYLKFYFDFLWAMTEKEIKARYKRAVFGFLWVVLNPLLQMLVIGAIFSFFIKIPDYFLFLFSGLLAWQFFSLSLSKATPSIVYERTLLQKAKFPIEAIPLSIILANFFHMLVSLILLFMILVPLGKIAFPQILLLIPALLWILIITIGSSLFFRKSKRTLSGCELFCSDTFNPLVLRYTCSVQFEFDSGGFLPLFFFESSSCHLRTFPSFVFGTGEIKSRDSFSKHRYQYSAFGVRNMGF